MAWDGEALAARYIQRIGRERLVSRLREALNAKAPEALDRVLNGYGKVSDKGLCCVDSSNPQLEAPGRTGQCPQRLWESELQRCACVNSSNPQ